MSIKERLLKLKDHIHTVEIDGEKYYYKHMTAPQLAIAQSCKSEQMNSAVFALCACEEDGSPIFTMEELDEVEALPIDLVTKVVNAIFNADEKKPQDA